MVSALEEAEERILRPADYAVWALCIALVFVISMYVGLWGFFRDPNLSPQTRVISSIYSITFVVAMGVFSIFAGTLIFFVIKFRARGGEVEEG